MRTHILITCVLTLFANACQPARKTSFSIARDSFNIAGVSIFSTSQEVRIQFGPPDSVTLPETSEVTGDTSITYFYPGLQIYFEDNRVYNLKCTVPSYWTADSIHVGSTITALQNAYGNLDNSTEERLELSVQGTDTKLIFKLKDGIVSEIELWLDYT